MLPPRGSNSRRTDPEPGRSPATCLPAPASVAPSCKQLDTPEANTTPPRGERVESRSCASAHQPARRSAKPDCGPRRALRPPTRSGVAALPDDRNRGPDVEATPRSIVSTRKLRLPPTGLPITPMLPSRLLPPRPTCQPRRKPDLEVPTTNSTHRLVPYRLDTPTTSQVAPRDHQLVSEGRKKPPSTRDQECPALPASCEALAPTLPPEPDFRELGCHESTRCVYADARC